MELSKLTDKLELQLQREREENVKRLVDKLQELLGVSLYESAKTANPIEAFYNNCFFLLDKFEKSLYEALRISNIPVFIFWREALLSFVLGITRNKSNVEFLKQLFLKRGIIKDYQIENGNICISTVLGPIHFRKLRLSEESVAFVENNVDIVSACHEATQFLLEKNHNYVAVTAFARKNLNGRYLHSFLLDRDYVIDLTANLYMKKEDYYRLYGIEEIRMATYQDYLRDSEESKKWDESGTMFPILRNAMYSYFTMKHKGR